MKYFKVYKLNSYCHRKTLMLCVSQMLIYFRSTEQPQNKCTNQNTLNLNPFPSAEGFYSSFPIIYFRISRKNELSFHRPITPKLRCSRPFLLFRRLTRCSHLTEFVTFGRRKRCVIKYNAGAASRRSRRMSPRFEDISLAAVISNQ